MHSPWRWLFLAWLWGYTTLAAAVSNAPLLALGAYIENPANRCSSRIVEWNREYGQKAVSGETPRSFYYRVLGYQDWGECGRAYFRIVFDEFVKVWNMFSLGVVSEDEFEAKEAELINLFFAAAKDLKGGERLIQEYQRSISARLIDLEPPRQFFDCTFFGEQHRCLD